ncbi:DNA polymerase delta subunit 3-like [Salvia splendens]|uniref:DNA polymerase delta subunit 3-like n=1 Tax=Salvia splendens TaxID=180675 RepID=UPI001C279593|nr:DNA polymerase delta subunit 3-like [Salvia splendens]
MAETAALGIIDEIHAFVSDRLQVISYKWLSRNLLVSSNAAKRLLEEFVEKHGGGLAVIYSLSGWLKSNPTTYHIRLVPSHMLSDAKEEFDGKCSVQVYSIQACLPKDPATLWNHEFVQAEDLFKQPSTLDNCLRDNRFCGVSNSFVKRTVGGTPLGTGSLQVKSTRVSGLSSSSIPQATADPRSIQNNFQNAGSNPGDQAPNTAKPVKTEGNVKPDLAQIADKEKVPRQLPNNKKGQNNKNSSGSGGSLASMWGRASAKPKPDACLVQAEKARQGSSAFQILLSYLYSNITPKKHLFSGISQCEAQISARESAEHEISDDDDGDKAFSTRRTSNGEGSRKRRAVFNYSDEEDEYDNAITLGSPDPPKKSVPCSKESLNASTSECNLSFEEEKSKPKIEEEKEGDVKAKPKVKEEKESDVKSKPKVKEEKENELKANQHLGENIATVSNDKKAGSPTSEKTLCHVSEKDASTKNTMANDVPKRRKVVKTLIDEKGREVTEVVWEGEEQDTKSNNNNSAKIAGNSTASNAINRPPAVRKSPAVGNTAPANQAGKAGNKKAATKDPKQGNLFSFFKKA